MNIETILLVIAISILSLVFIYEFIFILFFRNVTDKSKTKKDVTADFKAETDDIIVQPMPLGYDEPSIRKFEQCNTPVFEFTESNNFPEAFTSNPQVSVEKITTKNDHKKAPIIVVTAPLSPV